MHGRPYWWQWLVAALLATGVLGGSGCARVEGQSRERAFQEAVAEYGRMLRWGLYEAALEFVRRTPEPGAAGEGAGTGAPAPEPRHDATAALRSVRVTGYQVISQRFSPNDPNRAVVRARIEYYREDSPTLRELTDEQHWWYDEHTERWFLDGGLPDFSR